MERVSASLIEEIRNALVERYNRDQEIQQMIEEIGAEEGLNEKELFVIHQAYLEVKERMQYTANLMELWNQIEVVQDRMSMLNSYESLERDLFGDVLSFDKPMGYGASNQDNLDYAMEQIKLHDVDHALEDIDLAKEYPIDDQDDVYVDENSANKKTTSSLDDINDDEDDFDDESVLDRDIRTSLDPYDMVNSLLYSKQSGDDTTKTKQQKEIDKLIKKQLKRVEEEWAKLSGKNAKKDKKKKDKKKDKDTKKDKKDKQSKKESELVKESKKSKKDKESKKSKKDKDSKKDKKNKDAKKDKKAKKLKKALKKESKKSTKKD
ncbi:hypothetical protein [Veillonella atypica]|mgnify:CR=1 FL=1|uniref:Uncharacterized protein n=1 Tax=Veillonella atypica TaxID=39777 RepID=A0A3A6WGZ6_9FIRM|nr:hypothetical protein [Veillonella atypica]RJY51026.1 hypothetical protein D2965_02400 [Veillonella atypica]